MLEIYCLRQTFTLCCSVGNSLSLLCHQDYLRPSVESILQSSLLAHSVAEEQRKAQTRHQRRSAGSDCHLHKPAEPSATPAAELRLREQALRDREKALREREERLERECSASPSTFGQGLIVLWPGSFTLYHSC